MTELNDDQIPAVVGGVVPGPNGEGCTEPRKTEQDSDAFNALALLSGASVG